MTCWPTAVLLHIKLDQVKHIVVRLALTYHADRPNMVMLNEMLQESLLGS
jgi:hypothetical protein